MTSAAMVLDLSIADTIKLLGHDGSKILWPSEPEPLCRQGFHIEEVQYAARWLGVLFVPYVPCFAYNPGGDPKKYMQVYTFPQWKEVLKENGLLLGSYKRSPTKKHAVAWNATEGMIYDPTGHLSQLDDFEPETVYIAIRARV